MTSESSGIAGRRLTRRAVIAGGVLGLTGLAARALIGCGQDDQASAAFPGAGRYDVFLWLPDRYSRLRHRPEFAIRLANTDTWEAASGFNALGHTIEIGGSATGEASLTYASDDSVIDNPERGPFTPLHTGSTGFAHVDGQTVVDLRAEESTNLARWNVNIRQFRETDTISDSYLDRVQADLDTLREIGMKVIIRGQYDVEGDPTNDVPFERMALHIDQLASVFNENTDLIAAYEAGFVGRWGEWHGSTHYGSDWWPQRNWAQLPQVLQKVLDSFEQRPVMLRYPRHIRYMLNAGGEPRISEEHLPRLGFHNDSFLASTEEWGTYSDALAPDDREFVVGWVPGRAVSGEHEWDEEYSDQWRQERFNQFAEQHWSSMRSRFNRNVTDMWRASEHPTEEGTYWDVLRRRLGYRLHLTRAVIPHAVPVDAPIPMEIALENAGWAAPYNPRDVAVVLRNQATRDEYYLPIDTDVRTWGPEAGEIRLRPTWRPDPEE